MSKKAKPKKSRRKKSIESKPDFDGKYRCKKCGEIQPDYSSIKCNNCGELQLVKGFPQEMFPIHIRPMKLVEIWISVCLNCGNLQVSPGDLPDFTGG